MREELTKKLVAAGYDGDELSGMDIRELQNEVAKIEGTAPTNAISRGGQTAPSQYLNEQKKAEYEKKKAEYEKKKAKAEEPYLGAKRNSVNAMLGIDGKSLGTQPEVAELVSQRDAATVNNDKDAYTEADNKLKDLENPKSGQKPKPETDDGHYSNKNPSDWGSFADYVTAKNKDGGSGIKDYLIADALATFARNTGKDIGNVAAAYSGGTMNNDRETSLLEKRNAQKAQAETEEQIGKENPNSRLGQELKAHGLDIESREGSLALANHVRNALYKEDGSLKYPAGSPEFNELTALYNQLKSGGGEKDSILDSISRLINKGISFLPFW